jgi:multiple sugar transport system permease protein
MSELHAMPVKTRRFVSEHLGWMYTLPAMLTTVLLVVYPMIFSMTLSFRQRSPTTGELYFVGLENFRAVLSGGYFYGSLITTFVFMITSVIVTIVLGYILASMVLRIPRGRSLFIFLFIIPMAVAPVIGGLTWRWMYNPLFGWITWALGLLHHPPIPVLAMSGLALPGIIAVDVWQNTPLTFLILYSGLSGLPREIYEAAALDGAPSWTTFRRITFPLMQPVVLVALLLRTIDSFRAFDAPYVLTQGGPGYETELLSVYIYRTGFWFNDMSKATAAGQLMLIVLTVITLVYFRFLYREIK